MNNVGTMCMVNVDDLHFDLSYQRSEVSEANTRGIAKNWDWTKFGCICVQLREDGEFYVTDGCQRVLAARLRGIREVPAIIHESLGRECEAEAFIGINSNRKYVSACEKFKAAIVAGRPMETEVSEWLRTIGLDVRATSGPGYLTFPTTLMIQWKSDPASAQRAILTQMAIADGERPLHHAVHRGLWWLERHGVQTIKHVPKLMARGGIPKLLSAINSLAGESKVSYDRVAGLAILGEINWKAKTRVRIDAMEE